MAHKATERQFIQFNLSTSNNITITVKILIIPS